MLDISRLSSERYLVLDIGRDCLQNGTSCWTLAETVFRTVPHAGHWQRLSSERYLMLDIIALLVFLIQITTVLKPLTYDLGANFCLIRMYGPVRA